MPHTDRIVVLIDMDCFYCQVEEQLDPNLIGKPIAVVQYNQWKGGGIIAVNYIAREKGVTRQMRGDEAKEICPGIQLPKVPQVRGKADLTKYREAGKRVAEVLLSFTNLLERASIDEAYLDLTDLVNTELKQGIPKISTLDLQNTFVVGCETPDFLTSNNSNLVCEDDLKLAIGGVIVEKIRAEVLKKTGFKCSAGIAHNKTLAKLVCGLHKPNKQTILPQHAVPEMFSNLPVRKIKSLGGKFGYALSEKLKIECIGEVVKFTEKELIQNFDEKAGRWLYNICRGIDNEPVQIKLIPKSIGCCKRFPGKTALCKLEDLTHWINELSQEISERLYEDLKDNNRKGRLMTVGFSQETNQTEVSSTRAVHLKSYEVEKITQSALEVLSKNCRRSDGSYHVTFLGLTISNFENTKNIRSIESYFKKENNSDANKNISEKINKNTPEVAIETNIETSSNFSESTISLDENPEDLVFYDTTTTSNTSPYPVQKNNSSTSIGSLEEEILTSNSPVLCTGPGFFARYFENRAIKPCERNFDTSKILDAESTDEDDSEEKPYENCTECGESILIEDLISHMDYHLAMKLSKETSPVKKSEISRNKNRKVAKNSVLTFFKNETHDEPTELCSECKKRVRLTDIESHSDYHVAKKLHLEINNSLQNSTLGSQKKAATQKPKKTIASFFNVH